MLTHTLIVAAVVLVPAIAAGTVQSSALANDEPRDIFNSATNAGKDAFSQVLFHRGSGRCTQTTPC